MENTYTYHEIYSIKNLVLAWRKTRKGKIKKEKMAEIFQGWNTYAKWSDSFNLRKKVFLEIISYLP